MIQIKKTILTLVALLAVTTGAWADETYTITFAANGNTKTVENVTLPKTFQCNYDKANGELDLILKELYSWTGNANQTFCDGETTPQSSDENKVVAGSDNGDHYITINNVFEGTVTITGYYVVNSVVIETPYSLEISIAASPSGPKVAWDKEENTGTFTMPGGNVTLEPEYYPQAALTAAPTAINDVPATTDGAIVKAGTVANIGSTETAQGTVMYYVSQTALDDAALLALAADKWTADVPTAEKLTKGQADVYYYVRGNDSDTDEENFSDGDILAANALTVTIAPEPTKVTMAANDNTMGTVSMGGETKVEWTPTTWSGWNTGKNTEMTKSDGGITMTYTNDAARPYDGMIMDYGDSHVLDFLINEYIDDCTVTFSSDEGNISRIELSMTEEYFENPIPGTTYTYGNPHILPLDGWTFNGKSAVWEGEATKSLTLQSCSTEVSKITFFKEAIPEGVIVNTDGTFTVAKTATVKLTATPKEGYKFLYWDDDPTNTNPVREVTIEPGEDDMTYKAVFAEITYNVTFAEGTDPNEWTASPNADVKKGTPVTVTYSGTRKVMGVKAEKKAGGLLTLSVCGETIYYAEGETWAEAIQNHPTENQGWEIFDGDVTHENLGYLFQNDDFVPGTAKIDPNASYSNGSI